jgi:hypothetical protein
VFSAAWVGGTVGLLCFILKLVVGNLAYTPEKQREGMDSMKHGGMQGPETYTTYTPGLSTGLKIFTGVPTSPSKSAISQAIPQSTLPVGSPRLKSSA